MYLKDGETGYIMYTKGASEIILARCESQITSSGDTRSLTDADKADLNGKHL